MKITAPMMRVLQKGRAMTTFHDLAAKWEAEADAMIEDGGECEVHMAREVMTRAAELRAEIARGGRQTMESAPTQVADALAAIVADLRSSRFNVASSLDSWGEERAEQVGAQSTARECANKLEPLVTALRALGESVDE